MKKSIALYASTPHDCSYLDNKLTTSLFVNPDHLPDHETYCYLIKHGYRRSGNYIYKPACQDCHACIPLRLPVNAFKLKRSQKRCINKNKDLRIHITEDTFKESHYQLYRAYTDARHPSGGMDNATPDEYISAMASQWCDTRFVEFYDADKLIAVAVIDGVDNGTSAVYTFFDPGYQQRSLGAYAILWTIEWTKQAGLHWYYLGYWIMNCEKMRYKNQYTPIEAFIDGKWKRFENTDSLETFYQSHTQNEIFIL